jgi:hypothetical protein
LPKIGRYYAGLGQGRLSQQAREKEEPVTQE